MYFSLIILNLKLNRSGLLTKNHLPFSLLLFYPFMRR